MTSIVRKIFKTLGGVRVSRFPETDAEGVSMNKNWRLFLLGATMVTPLVASAVEDTGRIDKRFEKPVESKS